MAFDASMDIAMKGMWELAKDVLAVSYDDLVSTSRTPTLITYSEKAKFIDPELISDLHFEYVYGTNLQAALRAAQQVLGGLDEKGRVLVIGYAEPSAHCVDTDNVYFNSPPIPETTRLTMAEASNCANAGIRVDILLLSGDSPLENLGVQITSESGGVCEHLTTELPIKQQVSRFLTGIGLV